MKLLTKSPRVVIDAILVALASMGAVFCLITAFEISVTAPVVVLAAAVSALLFVCSFHWKPLFPILLALGAAAVAFGIATGIFAPVLPTLQQLAHDILTRFSKAYPNFSFFIPPSSEVRQDPTLVFSLLAVLVSLWMAWGVGYRSCLISVAGTLPFLLLCVTINDTPPHVLPLILLLSVWLTVLLCKERPEDPVPMDAARLATMLMAVLLLVGIVGTVYPKDSASDLPQLVQDFLDKLPDQMQDMLSRESEKRQEEQSGADVDEVLDLTTQGARNRTDDVMLQVSTTSSGVLYLRGAAKDVYTGSSWESRDEAGVSASVYAHTSLGQAFGDSYQAAVQVRNVGEQATVVFTPYGFLNATGMEDIRSDLRIYSISDDYINYYWPDIGALDLTQRYDNVNAEYDDYVTDTCLSLPEETREILYDMALRYGYDPDLSLLDTIAWVAEFTKTIGDYRLNVSRQPINYDFAVYFLTESRAGYCVHFATAAAVMYRALGIPARYASGYRVEVNEDAAVTEVTDRDTHAWAEIYISGLGWIPVEVTPGFGNTLALPEVEHAPELQEGVSAPELPSPSPSAVPEETAEPSPDQPEQQSEATPEPTPEPETPQEQTGNAVLRWLLLLPAAVLLGLAALAVRRRAILSRRQKQFRQKNSNAVVIAQWQYLEHLVPYGAELSRELETLALKAKFSQHTITGEELDFFSASAQTLALTTRQKLTGWKRLRFTWLSCLDWK